MLCWWFHWEPRAVDHIRVGTVQLVGQSSRWVELAENDCPTRHIIPIRIRIDAELPPPVFWKPHASSSIRQSRKMAFLRRVGNTHQPHASRVRSRKPKKNASFNSDDLAERSVRDDWALWGQWAVEVLRGGGGWWGGAQSGMGWAIWECDFFVGNFAGWLGEGEKRARWFLGCCGVGSGEAIFGGGAAPGGAWVGFGPSLEGFRAGFIPIVCSYFVLV